MLEDGKPECGRNVILPRVTCVCVCVYTRVQYQLSSRLLCNGMNNEMYETIILHIAHVGVKLGLSH